LKRALAASLACLCLFLCPWVALAQENQKTATDSEKARVFITDSQSWSVAGSGGGSGGSYGSAMAGGARPQTAEIIKTFGERCPEVMVNNIQAKTDYIVLLDHEGGKGALRHKNKVAVFARVSGDSIVSKSTLSLGGSVQDACEAIFRDWAVHGPSIRAATVAAAEQNRPAANPQAVALTVSAPAAALTGKLSLISIPDGADIEVDGSFVGNTPSDVQVTEGDHTVTVRKAGFKDWERKLRVSGGSSVRLNAELEKVANP
jgi:PEGA domain